MHLGRDDRDLGVPPSFPATPAEFSSAQAELGRHSKSKSSPNRGARADGTPCTYTKMCRILKNSELREAPMERGSSHGSATNSCFHALPDSEIYTPEYMHFLWQLSAIKAASLRPPVSPLLSRLQGWGLTGKDRPWEYERDVEICPRDRLLMKSS